MDVAQRLCSGRAIDGQEAWKYYAAFLTTYYTDYTQKGLGVRACAWVRVCVTSPLLKVPAYLAKLAGRTNFYVLMREIYYMGVVPSSVQLFRKWEINFDSENCSAITSVFLLVSEAQGVQPSSANIIPMPSPPKHIFVRVMSTVLKPQIICLQFPLVALPWSVREIPVGVVPPSVEAFRKWEDNSDSIQLTDCWHCSAVTNTLSSKADIGTASLYTKSAKMLCGPSLHNTNADCVQKVFCWCVVTSESLRSRKIAWAVSPHTLSQCRVCTNTFSLVWCQHCWTPKLSGYATKMSLKCIKFELFCVQLRHLKIVTRTPARYIALTACGHRGAITEGLSQRLCMGWAVNAPNSWNSHAAFLSIKCAKVIYAQKSILLVWREGAVMQRLSCHAR